MESRWQLQASSLRTWVSSDTWSDSSRNLQPRLRWLRGWSPSSSLLFSSSCVQWVCWSSCRAIVELWQREAAAWVALNSFLTQVISFCVWLNFVKEVQRPHHASQAAASPRVFVGEVSQFSGGKAVRSFKAQNSCTEGGSNKGCFFVTDLTGKTLTVTSPLDSSISSPARDIAAVTCSPVERLYFVVAGRCWMLTRPSAK